MATPVLPVSYSSFSKVKMTANNNQTETRSWEPYAHALCKAPFGFMQSISRVNSHERVVDLNSAINQGLRKSQYSYSIYLHGPFSWYGILVGFCEDDLFVRVSIDGSMSPRGITDNDERTTESPRTSFAQGHTEGGN